MYRDSQYGLCIDISGPEGNAFSLMGCVDNFTSQIYGRSNPEYTKEKERILEDMKSSDYEHLLDVFNREFGMFCTLVKDGEPVF